MAGSYSHVVRGDGSLNIDDGRLPLIENLGDAVEAIEEMYGMIWRLGTMLAASDAGEMHNARELIARAERQWQRGIASSPGSIPGKDVTPPAAVPRPSSSTSLSDRLKAVVQRVADCDDPNCPVSHGRE